MEYGGNVTEGRESRELENEFIEATHKSSLMIYMNHFIQPPKPCPPVPSVPLQPVHFSSLSQYNQSNN